MRNEYLEKYRQSSLREAQLKMLDILQSIDAVCASHSIGYWLEGGTLLGAVRHGGFIPWDDDLDISMLRIDYEKFLEVAQRELPPHLFVQTRDTDPEYRGRGCKVRDLNSYIADADDDNSRHYQKGLFVDVFPYDDGPSKARGMLGKVARSLCVADTVMHKPHAYSCGSALRLLYFGIKRPLLQLVWRLGRLTANGRYLAVEPYFSWRRAIHPKEEILPLGKIAFEGHTFSAPANPDLFLQRLYGDWRQVPPPEQQQAHSMIMVASLCPDD